MANLDYLTQVRRALHKLAEPSEKEERTSDFIFARLKEMGYRPRRIHTGLTCEAKGKRTDKKIALRADMDALPIVEKDCPFKADGNYMHACGHDGHMAMLLSAAQMAAKEKPEQTVRFIFQFGEEGGTGGAEKMIEGGAIEDVDEIYALHLCPELPLGQLATGDGALFAGDVAFDVSFAGKSSHCASKADGHDALAAAVRFYEQAQGVNADCANNTLFHIGKLEGGTVRSAVAASATAHCTLRYFDTSDVDKLMMRLEHMAIEADGLFGTEHRVTVHSVYPPLVNNPQCVRNVLHLCNVQTAEPRFTGEDFAFYLQKIKGAIVWLGCRDEKHTSPLHSDTFGFDEKALLTGAELYEKLMYSSKD
ncbi:MAG: amidohydrolase [Clostridiales bacterium]|nr:amidohydrolase [Clostridiales bacterium]